LIHQERLAGRLQGNFILNCGTSHPEINMTNTYNGLIPDIRLDLGNYREAVWDITTFGETSRSTSGHAGASYSNVFVDYIADLPYEMTRR